MDRREVEIQQRIESERELVSRRGCGFSADVRRDVARLVRERVAAGVSQTAMAQRLGVSDTTISRWLRASATEPAVGMSARLVPVVVSSGASQCGSVDVVTPGGYRLTGLVVADAIALWRTLP